MARPGPRWLFVGRGLMGAAGLAALLPRHRPLAVLTADPPPGAVAGIADAHDLEVHHVDRVGASPETRWPALFEALDVVVCCCWTERIHADVLGLPAHGWVNLHPSALPAWRGADPVAWQLLTAPAQIGCSVHRMTERQDEGPVVAEARVAVAEDDDRETLLQRSATRLGELAADVLADLAAGEPLRERPQDPAEATWCPPPGVVPLVDPRVVRAETAARVARAFSPQPGIALAALADDARFAAPVVGRERAGAERPGTVAALDEHNVAVACRDRWLRGRVWHPGA